MDKWTPVAVEELARAGGNACVNAELEALLTHGGKPRPAR